MIFLDENRSIITYDEDWQSVSEPEYAVAADSAEDEPIVKEKLPRARPKNLLLTIQLVACVLIGLAAFALKGIGGDAYSAARSWYCSNLNDTAIFGASREFDGRYFLATADEA